MFDKLYFIFIIQLFKFIRNIFLSLFELRLLS
nr:MAG TPA: hypothetical protein [Caudoviricetes sp.]